MLSCYTYTGIFTDILCPYSIVPEKSKTPVSRRPRAPPGPPPPVLSPVERATELFKKHGIEITPGSLPRADTSRGERVYKEIRMRVHRTCHRCSTSYGADKTCLTCGHRRCKQCPRFPYVVWLFTFLAKA